MEKKEALKEKKRALKDKKKKILFELNVTVDNNDEIKVNGPINDPLLILRILAGAMNTIVDYNMSPEKLNADIEAARKERERNKIVDVYGLPSVRSQDSVIQAV